MLFAELIDDRTAGVGGVVMSLVTAAGALLALWIKKRRADSKLANEDADAELKRDLKAETTRAKQWETWGKEAQRVHREEMTTKNEQIDRLVKDVIERSAKIARLEAQVEYLLAELRERDERTERGNSH